MLINIFLALSNLLGLPALVRASWSDRIIIILIMGLSFLMHISETKHHLKPGPIERYSTLFLNLDRGISFGLKLLWARLKLETVTPLSSFNRINWVNRPSNRRDPNIQSSI